MFFFFKQKTAYEMRISDWSSDVCSSDLAEDRIEPDGTIDAGHDEHSFEHRLHRLQPATHRFGIAPDRQLTGEGFELFLRRRHSLPSMLRFQAGARSEARRVGKECVSTCSSRLSAYPQKKKTKEYN